ncbi:MAG: oligopeptide/dipeptide ABC transporter ATP-binding protein [Candidatus Coproplasma sp.]
MLDFIEAAKAGIKYSAGKSIENKRAALAVIDEILPVFKTENLDKKTAVDAAKKLVAAVEFAIDRLEIVKDNTAYTFRSGLQAAIDLYFDGEKRNVKEEKRFARQTAKYEKKVAKGKAPEYKVADKSIVDLEKAKADIVSVITRVKADFEKSIAEYDSIDFDKKAVAMIDYFKANASAVVYRVTRRMAKTRALKLLEEVGIPEPRKRYKQYPFEFSGGMRQRIVIAIALSANPDILICDEPTTALDVTIQSQILELINKVKKERQLSVIFITHDLGVVANMADRVAVMYAGKIVEIGTTNDIFYSPAHPYTWALLSSMPDLDTKEKLEAIPGTPPNMIYPPKGDAFAERNKYALKIDFEQQPPFFKISDTHYAATWLLHPDAPKVDPPKSVTDRIKRMKEQGRKRDGE